MIFCHNVWEGRKLFGGQKTYLTPKNWTLAPEQDHWTHHDSSTLPLPPCLTSQPRLGDRGGETRAPPPPLIPPPFPLSPPPRKPKRDQLQGGQEEGKEVTSGCRIFTPRCLPTNHRCLLKIENSKKAVQWYRYFYTEAVELFSFLRDNSRVPFVEWRRIRWGWRVGKKTFSSNSISHITNWIARNDDGQKLTKKGESPVCVPGKKGGRCFECRKSAFVHAKKRKRFPDSPR